MVEGGRGWAACVQLSERGAAADTHPSQYFIHFVRHASSRPASLSVPACFSLCPVLLRSAPFFQCGDLVNAFPDSPKNSEAQVPLSLCVRWTNHSKILIIHVCRTCKCRHRATVSSRNLNRPSAPRLTNFRRLTLSG